MCEVLGVSKLDLPSSSYPFYGLRKVPPFESRISFLSREVLKAPYLLKSGLSS